MLAVPAEVYKFRSHYAISFLGIAINGLIAIYITIPVFCKLNITSTYEYLSMRFNSKVKLLASLLYTLSMILYLSIMIYGPALAFEQGES